MAISITYRGTPVDSIEYNAKDDTYSLFDLQGGLIADLLRHEYLSQPKLKTLRLSNGRHRKSFAQDQRGSNGKSGQAGRDDTLDAWLYATGTVTNAVTPKGPSLGALDAKKLLALYDAVLRGKTIGGYNAFLTEFEKPALKREGIVAGEIVGYRCWKVKGGLLHSVYQKDVWQPGQVLEGRELGDWDSRGIHAWKDKGSKHYHDYIRGYLNQEHDPRNVYWYSAGGHIDAPVLTSRPAMVTGTVFLWGDVVEHERGYRAEFARVRSLDWLYPDETMMGREQAALDELRARYSLTSSQQT